MKLTKKMIIPVTALAIALAAAGCGNAKASSDTDMNSINTVLAGQLQTDAQSTSAADTNETSAAGTSAADGSETDASVTSDMFSTRDFEIGYEEADCVKITLNGTSASCDSSLVSIEGGTVTIMEAGTYLLSGNLTDGSIVVDVPDTEKVQLVLDGVDITNETGAAIYVKSADKVFLTTTQDSENNLANGGTFTQTDEANIDAVIFSKEDLTLNGSGTLTVSSPAGHGIVSKDSLKITSGTYEITASSHGIDGKDDVCIANASLTITAGKDGIHAENTDDAASGFVYIQSGTFHITSEGDGISGAAYVTVEDGDLDITAGGGSENGAAKTANQMGGPGGQGGFGNGGGRPGGHTNDNSGSSFGGQRPDGMQDFSGQRPEGMQDFSGQQPDGMELPDNMQPEGDMQAEEQTDTDGTTEITSSKGIKSAGTITINGGTYVIDAADDTIHANGSIEVNGGSLELQSGDDGFHADESLTVNDGTIRILKSYEGLEGLNITIAGGGITLTATDDGLNAAGGNDQSGFGGMFGGDQFGSQGAASGANILISGGSLKVTAYGDALDSNGNLTITGGTTICNGPNYGDTSILDYNGTGSISGGSLFGTGGSGMSQSISSSGQGVININAGSQSAGTEITVTDSSGNEILSTTPELDFNLITVSAENLEAGQTYTVTIGNQSQTVTAESR